jgi:hypothetical protein
MDQLKIKETLNKKSEDFETKVDKILSLMRNEIEEFKKSSRRKIKVKVVLK